jgi:hypothetical protein
MENVLDIYKRPYNPEFPVVCMDEAPRQLIKETRGVYTIFIANEPLAGKRLTKTTERRTRID